MNVLGRVDRVVEVLRLELLTADEDCGGDDGGSRGNVEARLEAFDRSRSFLVLGVGGSRSSLALLSKNVDD